MKKTYQIHGGFLKFAEVDNFNEGCDPDTSTSYTVDGNFRGNTAKEVIEKAAKFLGIESDGIEKNACDEPGRVDFAGMECEDGTTPSKHEMKEWKAGRLKLWYVVYTAYVEEVTPAKL